MRHTTHRDPAWRARSNFIISIDVESLTAEVTTEQLWARQVDERLFELCCIPFFAYDLALGDVVETDKNYRVNRLVQPSGRYVFRVWFGSNSYPRADVAADLAELGGLFEWSSENLLAVDARDSVQAGLLTNYLRAQEDAGRLIYETGKIA